MSDALISLYLDLLKRCLINLIYEDPAIRYPWDDSSERVFLPFDRDKRLAASDWPSQAHTMIGMRRLDNIQVLISDVLDNGTPGDLIETGVWRGGSTIFMRGVLKAYGVTDRSVWVADSFEGVPPPDAATYPADAGDTFHKTAGLAVGIEEVQHNFERYGLLDDQVRF